MGILFHGVTRKTVKSNHWSPIILLLILIALAIWATQCRQYALPLGNNTQGNIACSANGYQAVYYPFLGSPYQQIILENTSGTKSSLNKFFTQYIKDGNQALADIRGLVCLDTLEIPYIAKAKVTDLTPLATLVNLKTLTLLNTDVTDIAPLAQLSQLKSLTISLDQPVSLMPLTGLKYFKTFTVCGQWVNKSCVYATVDPLDIIPHAPDQYPQAFSDLKHSRPSLDINFGFVAK